MGFMFGVIFTLAISPLLIKWYIQKKIEELTGVFLK